MEKIESRERTARSRRMRRPTGLRLRHKQFLLLVAIAHYDFFALVSYAETGRDKFNERGQLEGFEIDGISEELCTKYSQRRGEIEERIADFKAEHGREPTTAEIHVIAKETRTSKLIEISTEQVRAQQRERASAEELAQIDRVKAQAYARQENQTANTDATELVSLVRDHLAERRATFGEHDLI